ncbi:MAG: DNA adenine methylase [Terracidiphilus sp.]
MYGPFSYIGGKRALAGRIIEMFPEHKTYIEPFAGGAQVFFRKEPSKVEVLNDLDREIVNFYRICQSHFEELVRYLRFTVVSRAWFDLLNDSDPAKLTDIQRAARHFYLSKNCYGALTLGSLIFTVIKNALFTRERRSLFTVYCDEMQNLIAYSSDVETVLSEARKFGVSVVSANQFLDQYPAPMRAAILSIGTHVFFQLSSADASQVAQMLDGGKPLAERLKNLPQRHFVLKSCADHWVEGIVPTVENAKTNYADLVNRSRALRSRPRAEIEAEIATRHEALTHTTDEVLHDWN